LLGGELEAAREKSFRDGSAR